MRTSRSIRKALSGRSAKVLAIVAALAGMWLVGDARLPDWLRPCGLLLMALALALWRCA